MVKNEMENQGDAQTKTLSATESIHIQAKLWDTEEKAFWQQFKQRNGLTENSETLRAIVNQLRILQSSPTAQAMPQEVKEISEKCKNKGCPAYPYFDAKSQEMLCVFPFEGKEPKISRRSIVESKACSDAPILVSMARKREMEQEFETQLKALTAQLEEMPKLHAYNKALREMLIERDSDITTLENYQKQTEKQLKEANRKLQPMQDLLTEKDTLKSEVFDVKNALLRRDEEIGILKTDNEQLRKIVQELSHDALIETNRELSDHLEEARQLLKVEENGKIGLIGEYKTEIEAKEALVAKRSQTLNEVISKTLSLFADVKRFLPKDIEYEINVMRKTMEQFEGYLETMRA
jgi:hypothetical protein